MALVSSVELLLDAQRRQYAVPAFNVEDMEMVLAVAKTADRLQSPLILQTTPGTIRYAGLGMLFAIAQQAAKEFSIPIALHLDHGDSVELCQWALKAGYTSVMYDGSRLPYPQNVANTAKVVQLAQEGAASSEGELGAVGGKEDQLLDTSEAGYTDPEQAADFSERTGVNALAVAIGTAHGFYKGVPKLDFPRLREIRSRVSVPLVLHGASGLPDETVTLCVENGCCKINFATELRAALTKGVRRKLKDPSVYDPKAFMREGMQELEQVVAHKIQLCKSAGAARP